MVIVPLEVMVEMVVGEEGEWEGKGNIEEEDGKEEEKKIVGWLGFDRRDADAEVEGNLVMSS